MKGGIMPFNMAWFKAQAEKKKAEEAAKLATEETTNKWFI